MTAQESRMFKVYRGLVGWRVICRGCLWSQRSYRTWPVAMHAAEQHYRHWLRQGSHAALTPFSPSPAASEADMTTQNQPLPTLRCDVCHDEDAVGVAAMPGVPISFAYGRRCLDANAHPWGAVVANTAAIGHMEFAADWWKQLVVDTCRHLGKSLDEFEAAVAKAVAEEDEALRKLEDGS